MLLNLRSGPVLCIANTGHVAADSTYGGVVFDEVQEIGHAFSKIHLVIFSGRRRSAVGTLSASVQLHEVRLPGDVLGLTRAVRMWFEVPALFFVLTRMLRKEHVDVIRADDTIVAGLPVAILGKVFRIPTYVFLAGSVTEIAAHKAKGVALVPTVVRLLMGGFERVVLRATDGALAVNEGLSAYARCHGSKLVGTSPSYVSQRRFSSPLRNPGRDAAHEVVNLRFVGRLEREKGIYDLLNAVQMVLDRGLSGLRLEYVGGGSETDGLWTEVRLRQLDRIVGLRGLVPHAAMHDVLESTDILVLPSYTEGSPVVVFEAMLMGVPVIATPVGSIGETFEDGVNIVLVEPGRPTGLAQAIECLVSSPQLRRTLGEAGRATAMKMASSYFGVQRDFAYRVAGKKR